MKYLIIGLGVFGRNLAHNLSQIGAEVIAIDRREDNVTAVKDEVATAVCAPFDDPYVLSRFPIAEFDAVILAIGDDLEASLAFTMKAQELGAQRLVCRVLSPMHERLLRLLKVDRLVVPEEFAARGLAHSLLLRGVVDGIDLGSGHALVDAAVPKPLISLPATQRQALFDRHAIQLVTIKRPDTNMLAKLIRAEADMRPPMRTLGNVTIQEPLKEGDVLVLFGQEKDLRRFLDEASE